MALAGFAAILFSGAVFAHHPPRFERCQRFTVEGQVTRVEWTNPHVALSIAGNDGMSYVVSWLNVRQLRLAGIERDELHVGDRVSIAATRQPEKPAPSLLQEIRRAADNWHWIRDPQGC
jgi:hypothetical protein